MANHVRNRLVIKATEQRLKEITDFLMGEPDEDGKPCHIDFENIIPIPEELKIEDCSCGDEALAIMRRKGCFGRSYEETKAEFDERESEEKKKYRKLARQYRDNIKKYGCKTWFDWCMDYWGTKWNAFNQNQPAPNEIWFDTAWSCVIRLVYKLSQMYPDAVFDYTYADENTGYNSGIFILRNGKGQMCVPDGGTREAYEIAFEMRPDRRSDYHFDGETYHRNGKED